MSSTITIRLPLPPSGLSPNARHGPQYRLKKKYGTGTAATSPNKPCGAFCGAAVGKGRLPDHLAHPDPEQPEGPDPERNCVWNGKGYHCRGEAVKG